MKKGCIFLAIWVHFLFSVTLQAETALWKVEGAKACFYLGGSCHVLRASDYPLPPEFEHAYKEAEVLLFETDMEALSGLQTQQKLLSIGTLPTGQTLKKVLSPAAYRDLALEAKKNGRSVQNLQAFKPWLVSLMLSLAEFEKLGIWPAYGLDQHFYARAKKDGKTCGSLESIGDHLALFDNFDTVEPDDVVRQHVEEMDLVRKKSREMLDAWRNGDEETIDAVFLKPLRKSSPALNKVMLTDRNEAWIPALEKWIGSGKSVLVIVGVGHLVGPGNVRELLAKKGRTIHRVGKKEAVPVALSGNARDDLEERAPARGRNKIDKLIGRNLFIFSKPSLLGFAANVR
jgi:uncharacterized protein YbaP (TraB family)